MSLKQAIHKQSLPLVSIALSPQYKMPLEDLASRVRLLVDVIPNLGDIEITLQNQTVLLKDFDNNFTMDSDELEKLNRLILSRVQSGLEHLVVSREQQTAICQILIPDDISVSDLCITAKLLCKRFIGIKKACLRTGPQHIEFSQFNKLSPSTSPKQLKLIASAARHRLQEFLLGYCF